MGEAPGWAKPRRVTYRGRAFRSVLEARWAKTLDELGIAWEYEPKTVRLSDGRGYVPDFWLSGSGDGVWLEVKGNGDERLDKALVFRDDGNPIFIGRMPNHGGRLFWESFPGDNWRPLRRVETEAWVWVNTCKDGFFFTDWNAEDTMQGEVVSGLRLAELHAEPRRKVSGGYRRGMRGSRGGR